MRQYSEFYKYQGTGNDFIMIDNRNEEFPKSTALINRLCDRRFGIGGDGLILLENSDLPPGFDFRMVYYNADGNQSTMCGNGGRCIVAFAHFLDIFEDKCQFLAIDGPHEAEIHLDLVKLKMIDVQSIREEQGCFILNTGSPHFVKYVQNIDQYDVYKNGREIRNSTPFEKEGINVNFVEQIGDHELFVRTYERGVEDETFSCGTGVTAAALAFMKDHNVQDVRIKVLGGQLKVHATKEGDSFHAIWLEGPAKQVFKGKISL